MTNLTVPTLAGALAEIEQDERGTKPLDLPRARTLLSFLASTLAAMKVREAHGRAEPAKDASGGDTSSSDLDPSTPTPAVLAAFRTALHDDTPPPIPHAPSPVGALDLRLPEEPDLLTEHLRARADREEAARPPGTALIHGALRSRGLNEDDES